MRSIYSLLLLLITLELSSCSEKKPTPREQSFDEGWLFHRGDIIEGERSDLDDSQWRLVNLPHDWSIENIPGTNSPFTADAITEVSGGFTVGGTGWYRKHFYVDTAEKGKCIVVAFDGIYMNADIWVNDRHVANHVYGYTAFELDITDYVRFGEKNLIAVRVKNEGLNCRWYTGSGIYRHTSLKITNPLHFETWGTFITTPVATTNKAEVHVQSVLANTEKVTGKVILETQIVDKENRTVAWKEQLVTLDNQEKTEINHILEVTSPQLWSTDNPYLYKVVNRLLKDNKIIDEECISIGIRNIAFSAENGFHLNGKSMKLKGGCIHHDNGPLGAKAFDRAEERKIELLKAAGFNALRLSHNPPSTALLNACDRLGMLVIDEAFDMWRQGHYKDDYGQYFDKLWKEDLYSMVARDRNHPCVIMWSIGNEIKNKETTEVVEVCRELTGFVKALDTTRPVTAGVNSIVDATDDFLLPLDVCGYNYCLNRYELDAKRHPDRIIYASESYASQAYDYWKGVENHSWVIGDFIWTAFDYIGEASIGWCGYPLDKRIFPWNHANCGDLNLSGERRPQSYLRETLWSEAPVSHIVVTPPVPSFPLNPDKAEWSVWDFPDVVERNMYITGGIGSSRHNEGFTEDYDLPNLEAYCETCASVGMVLWNHRMNQFTGDSKYIDVLERSMYNGALAGISLNGDRFFYVNPLESKGDHHRLPWYGCACCPSQLSRFLPSIGNYIYGISDNAIWVNLYIGNVAEVNVDGVQVTMKEETKYPWNGRIKFTINADEEINKELRLRIPGWCKKYNLFINGKKVKKLRIDKGYVVIADWNSGDNIELDFDMPVEVVKSDVRVKQNIGKRAIQRGPLVYCIEDAQNKDTIEGIYISPKTSFKTDFNVNLLNGVQQITAKDGKKTFTLIPYYAWDNMEAGSMKVWIDYKK